MRVVFLSFAILIKQEKLKQKTNTYIIHPRFRQSRFNFADVSIPNTRRNSFDDFDADDEDDFENYYL